MKLHEFYQNPHASRASFLGELKREYGDLYQRASGQSVARGISVESTMIDRIYETIIEKYGDKYGQKHEGDHSGATFKRVAIALWAKSSEVTKTEFLQLLRDNDV